MRDNSKEMKHGIIVLILWTLILLGLLLAPISETPMPTPGGFQHMDKITHFGLFFITGIVSVIGASFLNGLKARIIFGIVFGMFLAIGTEFAQSLLPLRNMSLYDLLADISGLGIALVLCSFLYHSHRFARFF